MLRSKSSLSTRAKLDFLLHGQKPKSSVKFVYSKDEIDAREQGVIWVVYNSPCLDKTPQQKNIL